MVGIERGTRVRQRKHFQDPETTCKIKGECLLYWTEWPTPGTSCQIDSVHGSCKVSQPHQEWDWCTRVVPMVTALFLWTGRVNVRSEVLLALELMLLSKYKDKYSMDMGCNSNKFTVITRAEIPFYKQHARAGRIRLLGGVNHAQHRTNKPLSIGDCCHGDIAPIHGPVLARCTWSLDLVTLLSWTGRVTYGQRYYWT